MHVRRWKCRFHVHCVITLQLLGCRLGNKRALRFLCGFNVSALLESTWKLRCFSLLHALQNRIISLWLARSNVVKKTDKKCKNGPKALAQSTRIYLSISGCVLNLTKTCANKNSCRWNVGHCLPFKSKIRQFLRVALIKTHCPIKIVRKLAN